MVLECLAVQLEVEEEMAVVVMVLVEEVEQALSLVLVELEDKTLVVTIMGYLDSVALVEVPMVMAMQQEEEALVKLDK